MKTLNSILNQSYKNYEIIFVYDDKNKKELDYINRLLLKFKKIIYNKSNLGVAKSRNIAMKYAKGSYITFIDSDDIWKKDKLKKQLKFMRQNSCSLSFTSYNVIDDRDKVIKEMKVSKDATYDNLYWSNFIGLSTVMINRKYITSKIHFPNLKTQEDFGFMAKVAKKRI